MTWRHNVVWCATVFGSMALAGLRQLDANTTDVTLRRYARCVPPQ